MVAAWIGLVGVVAGALIAFGGQYLMRRSDRQERSDTLLLEQFAQVIALCEDFRNRVWMERLHVANDAVDKWDFGAYRLAEARLRVLSQDPQLMVALKALLETGKELDRTWRVTPSDEGAVDKAWKANREAIERFVDISYQMIQHSVTLGFRRPHVNADNGRNP
jgi:hypothetical protein